MEDQIQVPIELKKKDTEDTSKVTNTLSEVWQDRLLVDSMTDEESMEQQLNDEPSLSEVEQALSPKEPEECVLHMISISPQHTPSRAKKKIVFSINPEL